jgi:hypothetical protein
MHGDVLPLLLELTERVRDGDVVTSSRRNKKKSQQILLRFFYRGSKDLNTKLNKRTREEENERRLEEI